MSPMQDRPEAQASGQNEFLRLDRSRIVIGTVQDEDPDRDYWLMRTPAERIAALEACREAFYGSDAVRGRVARVLEVARLR